MKDKLKIVLDTNILLVSISSHSSFHWIFKSLLDGKFSLCITNDILLEYEEIITKKFNRQVAKDVIRAVITLPDTQFVTTFYEWYLIHVDPDDNKFVDCAISANADYIVTNDKHFNILNNIDFPSLALLSIEQFELQFHI